MWRRCGTRDDILLVLSLFICISSRCIDADGVVKKVWYSWWYSFALITVHMYMFKMCWCPWCFKGGVVFLMLFYSYYHCSLPIWAIDISIWFQVKFGNKIGVFTIINFHIYNFLWKFIKIHILILYLLFRLSKRGENPVTEFSARMSSYHH